MHHFGTIGTLAYVGGLSRLVRDAPPFMITEGHPARIVKVNSIGLERAGIPAERVKLLKRAFRDLFRRRHATWQQAFLALDNDGVTSPEIERLRQHFNGIASGRHGRAREAMRG
jgi:UDP-N-acetylglucosamine acyltransferase